jgi:hypothetical protein
VARIGAAAWVGTAFAGSGAEKATDAGPQRIPAAQRTAVRLRVGCEVMPIPYRPAHEEPLKALFSHS